MPYQMDTLDPVSYLHELVPVGQIQYNPETQKLVISDEPVSETDIVNKAYVDAAISAALLALKEQA